MRDRTLTGDVVTITTLALLGLLFLQSPVARAEVPSRPTLEGEVLPLLKAHCIKCHGPLKPKAKLTLSTPKAIARGGENGPIVTSANLEESAIWEQVSENTMPPKPEDPLTADEKIILKQWIEQGAAGLPSAAEANRNSPGSDHWAFAKLGNVEPPQPRDISRTRTSIDRFLQKTLEDRGIARGLGADADKRTVIRRVALDLTGLPPTPEEIAAFLADARQDAYEKMVDRYLASPRYGERWGKHWLDASGYTDSNGYFNADSDRPLAYRYRDYIVRAFNADRPLDRVVREEIAGDELSGYKPGMEVTPDLIDQLTATHFLRNAQDGTGESDGNPDEVRADKYFVLEGAVQIMGSALFGLTTQCAKCHDHKFEPITQAEYYQLQAILYPAFNLENWVKPQKREVVAGLREIMAPWEAHEKPIDAEVAKLKADFAAKKTGPGVPKDQAALDKAIKDLDAKRLPNPGRIAWVADFSAKPPEVPLLLRGNPMTPAPRSPPVSPPSSAIPDNPYDPKPPYAGRPIDRPSIGPGELADEARLAPRRAPRAGDRQSDLAGSLRRRSGRHLREPGLYRIAAESSRAARIPGGAAGPVRLERQGDPSRDPPVHRLPPDLGPSRRCPRGRSRESIPRALALRRLDAEQIRDGMLFASGELDDRQGGPYVPTPRAASGEVAVDESQAGAKRRTIYLQQRRTQITSLLEVFDAPSIVTACSRRAPATIPLQSLSMLNSDFAVRRASNWPSGSSARPAPRPMASSKRAFVVTVGREPRPEEQAAASRFLAGSRPIIPAAPGSMPSSRPAPTSARCSSPATPSSMSSKSDPLIILYFSKRRRWTAKTKKTSGKESSIRLG